MSNKSQPTNNDIALVDINEVLKSKNPKLAKKLPGFVKKYLKRIVHQDEINQFLIKHKDDYGLDFLDDIVKDYNLKVEVRGKGNLPPVDGRYIFVSNHPMGGMDGVTLLRMLNHHYGPTKSLINDLIMYIPNLRGIFVGVNKHGRNSREDFKLIDNVFSSDDQLLIFPAGLVSRRKKGVIKDPEWQKTFINMAKKYHRDVVPLHITGRVSNFFYNLANLRTFLGIKKNYEMLYLVDETYKQQNKKYTVTIGKKIPYSSFDNRKRPKKWALDVQEHIYRLAKNPDITFSV